MASGKSVDELANTVLAVVLISSVEFSQGKFISTSNVSCEDVTEICTAALVHVVNLYMQAENVKHKQNIVTLCQTPGPASDAQLQGYVREALSSCIDYCHKSLHSCILHRTGSVTSGSIPLVYVQLWFHRHLISGLAGYAQKDHQVDGMKLAKDQGVFLSFANANVDVRDYSHQRCLVDIDRLLSAPSILQRQAD